MAGRNDKAIIIAANQKGDFSPENKNVGNVLVHASHIGKGCAVLWSTVKSGQRGGVSFPHPDMKRGYFYNVTDKAVTHVFDIEDCNTAIARPCWHFPLVDEEGREELERYIKKAGIWDEVSGLNILRLSKMLENEELDNKIKNGFLKFAEEVERIKVSLVKKGIKEED